LRALTRPPGEATDIAAAIRAALAALPASGGRRIVLATDGNANRGDLEQALALAAAHGVDVSVLPLTPGRSDDVLLEEIVAPAEVRVGERFAVRLPIVATTAGRVMLRLTENGRLIAQRSLRLSAGRTTVTVERLAGVEGVLRYAAQVAGTPDAVAGNNGAQAQVLVRGAPQVWYAAATPGPLASLLRTQRMRVRTMTPEALPARLADYRGVGAVVLDDVAALRLSPSQMAALRDYVGRLGGGLVVVGGPSSYGVGGYAGTPLEEALPVSMDVRHRLAIPSMAIILLLDTSGSMGAFGPQIAKVELAKETAQSVIDLLGERDVIGVISFDQQPRWLVPPTEARHRDEVMAQVARVQAGGGTAMYPALRLAADFLRKASAKVRHVIVISDGQTDPGDFEGLVGRMSRDRITTTTVAVGADADLEIMADIARWGGGRSYHARDLYSIPQILTAEALLASRAYIIEEPFTPQIVQRGLVDDLAPPPLRGYVATAVKPAGTVHLASPSDDPILAVWQYGVGRAAAFTSDGRARWAVEWMRWPDLARFWSRLVRWALREDEDGLQVVVEQVDPSGRPAPAGGMAAITVDAFTDAGDPVDGLAVEAHVVAPDGTAAVVPLPQAAPGRYEGSTPSVRPGPYTVSVIARGRGRPRVATSGFVVPYAPELRDVQPNRAVLARIVEVTGGRILTDPRAAVDPGRSANARAEGWPALTAVAVGLFLLEIAWRRLPAVAQHAAALVLSARDWLRRPPGAAQAEADRSYDEADRWKLVEEEPSAGSESMEAAARLYIARLKALREDDRRREQR
ncbi:MAG TPA: VWA domain-containing protein, partial [bacterium]|nr:VWA domain-containing protein [bacterium]